MFKLIFGIIKAIIYIIIIGSVILFPIVLYDINPFVFYYNKIKLLYLGLESSGLIDKFLNKFF
jgi:hypothetical protein